MKWALVFLTLVAFAGNNPAFSYSNNALAECSALNNNFNQKYGAQLLDSGETYNSILNDKLYFVSSSYQSMLMAKISYLENWNLSS